MISVYLGNSYISIYDDDMGGLYVEYANGIRKMTTMDLSMFQEIYNKLENSGLTALLGTSEYGDGMESASVSVIYSDWSTNSADYYGVTIPTEFITGFNNFAAYMEQLLADVEEYVPQAMVFGEVDAPILPEMQEVMNNSGIMNLDSLAIQGIMTEDEYFGYSAGLSSAEGLTAAAVCAPMMNANPFQLVIVSLEDEANAATVAADFEANLDFGKWVCVRPDTALIAVKGNLVLCLMAGGDVYTGTAAAVTAAGWTVINTVADTIG